jgi:hypothetical protein
MSMLYEKREAKLNHGKRISPPEHTEKKYFNFKLCELCVLCG